MALAVAGALVGAAILLSAVVNPLFGRLAHWNWMAVLGLTLLGFVSLFIRYRWV